jgi:hypothetical protein
MLKRLALKCIRGGQAIANLLIPKKYVRRCVIDETLMSVYPDGSDADLYHRFDVGPRPPAMIPPISKLQAEKIVHDPLRKRLSDPYTTRMDFTDEDWKQLDAVTFELVQEYFQSANILFNNGYEDANQERWKEWGLDRKEAVVAEALAKALAFCEGCEGKILALPVRCDDGVYRLVDFSIYKAHIGKSLPCYALVPEDPKIPCWFVMRGTEFAPFRQGCKESIYADFADPNAIGEVELRDSLQFRRGDKENLYFLFENVLKGRPLILSGHSLGGCLANALAVLASDRVLKSYAFGAPGVSETIMGAVTPEISDKLINFHMQGDLVSTAGRYLIGRHFVITEGEGDFVELHLSPHLNRREFALQKVDVEAENRSISRHRLERFRAFLGKTLFRR